MRKLVFGVVALVVCATVAAGVFIVHPAAASAPTPQAAAENGTVVTQASIDNGTWSTADTRPGGAVSFVIGPGQAPMGAGSLQMTTSSASAKAQMFTYSYAGTQLASLTTLGYADYRSSTSTNPAAQRIGLNIEVYLNGPNAGWTTLVYEPVYQSGGVGALKDNTWQTWNALGSGVWWSTKTVTGVGGTIQAFNSYWTWDHIMSVFPNAVIAGGLGFNIGSGWVGAFSGNADALAVGVSGATTTYNFEPDTGVCKNGGWQSYSFKNQGDCVSYIATGGKNAGN